MKKKIISVYLALAITASGAGCVFAEKSSDKIKVVYDGNQIEFDVEPQIINGRTMVPMRAVFETFGAKVKWDSETSKVTAKRKSKTIEMTIGSEEMTRNGEAYTFDAPPVIEDGRTLVPVRAIGDMLGLDVDWDEDEKTVTITTPADEDDDAWKENTGTIDLDTLTVTGEGASVSGNVISVFAGGDFEVIGTLDDGQIVVDAEEKVKLRLSGMSLTNTSGSAIYFKNADKAYITLTDNTENTLTDGETYTSGDEKETACITSRDNLEIKGGGSLTVNGNYNHGIDCSDSMEIGNGNIVINAKNDGIHVNETLEISGGSVTVTAEGDGIQAEEIVDISGGSVNVTTTGEVAVSANTDFGGGRGGMGGGMNFGEQGEMPQVPDGEQPEMGGQRQMSEGERPERGEARQMQGGEQPEMGGQRQVPDGGQPEMNEMPQMSDEERQAADEKMQKQLEKSEKQEIKDDGSEKQEIDADNSEDVTSKGIKAGWLMDISGGEITVNSTDHAVHCASDINISGGEITLASQSKKGISAHGDIVIDDGDITITKATEGIETKQTMTVNGGNIDITASDDGLNSGGNGMGDMLGGRGQGTQPENGMGQRGEMQNGGMPQMTEGEAMRASDGNGGEMPEDNMRGGMGGARNTSEKDSEHHIQINGGNITITADGDGIDSNGSLFIDGGNLFINAQASGAESAFDAEGAILFNGGEIIGVSGSGLDENPNSYSAQNVIIANVSVLSAGDRVTVTDSDGKTVFDFTPTKGGTKIVLSSDEIKTGETYTILAGGEELNASVESVITTVGTAGASQRGGGMGGDRGGRMKNTEQQ